MVCAASFKCQTPKFPQNVLNMFKQLMPFLYLFVVPWLHWEGPRNPSIQNNWVTDSEIPKLYGPLPAASAANSSWQASWAKPVQSYFLQTKTNARLLSTHYKTNIYSDIFGQFWFGVAGDNLTCLQKITNNISICSRLASSHCCLPTRANAFFASDKSPPLLEAAVCPQIVKWPQVC